MGEAWIVHVLNSIAGGDGRHRRFVVVTVATLSVALLALEWQVGALVGLGVGLCVLLAGVVTGLAVRLRAVERSHAALAFQLAELTARIEHLPLTSGEVAAVGEPAVGDQAGLVVIAPAPPDHTVGTDSRSASAGVPVAALWGESIAPAVSGVAQGSVDGAVAATSEPDPEADGPVTAEAEDGVAGSRRPATVDDSPNEGDIVALAGSDTIVPVTPAALPAFALPSLRGDKVAATDLIGRPAVIVFWRPGCPHCQRLTPELVAWESLQGPRLVVIAACDGPVAFRAGLPGTVLLDPGFTVGQALGAPGTPAALPIDAAARPTGPVIAGSATVTSLLLDAMRDWAAADVEPEADTREAASDAGPADDTAPVVDMAPPAVLLRHVEERQAAAVVAAPDWDADAVSRRAG